MGEQSRTVPYRSMTEWAFQSTQVYDNPFLDVVVEATFTSPSGKTSVQPGFYDGKQTWRIRFNPNETGHWHYHVQAHPASPDLAEKGSFEVLPAETRGFLQSTPGRAWGFHYESGEPAFILGDTTYHLFGMAYCGLDVGAFMQRRAEQGFTLLRARLPISSFHPPEAYNQWQTRHIWAWGGSEQIPQFDRFNLEYFQTVDRVMRQAEELGLGLELIMQGWPYEFPFNNRAAFLPEWEELWLRYLVARYDAFRCISFWTLLNEYEAYPDGQLRYKSCADLWAMRVGRWMKQTAPHSHIIALHINQAEPAFATRFRTDPHVIDTILFQMPGWEYKDWLTRRPIEPQVKHSFKDWQGSAIFAEYGYERNPELPLLIPMHQDCDPDHTRYGAWQGAFCGLGVIHGFDNSWGIFGLLDRDQQGLAYLLHLRRFLTELVPFDQLNPAPELLAAGPYEMGLHPQALATEDRTIVAVYIPVGGKVELLLPETVEEYRARWFDPRSGELRPINQAMAGSSPIFTVPTVHQGQDWAVILATSRLWLENLA